MRFWAYRCFLAAYRRRATMASLLAVRLLPRGQVRARKLRPPFALKDSDARTTNAWLSTSEEPQIDGPTTAVFQQKAAFCPRHWIVPHCSWNRPSKRFRDPA